MNVYLFIKVIIIHGQELSNVFGVLGESDSYKLEVFIVTTRELFEYVQLNITLKTTKISSYYASNDFSDENCKQQHTIAYTYSFNNFTIDSSDKMNLLKMRYVYFDYENKLCPLSNYETSLVVFNSSDKSNPIVYDTFETSKNN
jgi:hypothetical protein